MDDDVVDGVIEERNQSSDANDGEWLRAKDAEDYGRKCGGEECLIDAEEFPCSAVHVERICQCGQKAALRSQSSDTRRVHCVRTYLTKYIRIVLATVL